MDLQDFFQEHPKAALAFSGGVDSAFLLAFALNCGADIRPYCAVTPFQPEFELEDARKLCTQLGVVLHEVSVPLLEDSMITENSGLRCYFCKKRMISAIQKQALENGFDVLLDGTNASDLDTDRPGMKALREMNILSPLRLCGLDKGEIRRRSRELGLPTWDKPAYACLATRVPTGDRITEELLYRVEKAEQTMQTMGYRDFRVRVYHDAARIQVKQAEQLKAIEDAIQLRESLKPWFTTVLLDLEAR